MSSIRPNLDRWHILAPGRIRLGNTKFEITNEVPYENYNLFYDGLFQDHYRSLGIAKHAALDGAKALLANGYEIIV